MASHLGMLGLILQQFGHKRTLGCKKENMMVMILWKNENAHKNYKLKKNGLIFQKQSKLHPLEQFRQYYGIELVCCDYFGTIVNLNILTGSNSRF